MKKNLLLTADTHFDDNPLNAYRFTIFEAIRKLCAQFNIDEIHILGDVSDRKDRHSAVLLNRLVEEFTSLKYDCCEEIFVLAGNHDGPITGPFYWNFLNNVGINYITEPTLHHNIYLLPFSANPINDWQKLNLCSASALFIHQTVEGSMIEGNRTLKDVKTKLPILPRSLPVYAGDVHRPQKVGGITYIGAPYPVRFSEDWRCRMLIIQNGDFHNPIEVFPISFRREILDIRSTAELAAVKLKPGDQARVRFHLSKLKLTEWLAEEEQIRLWAEKQKILLASVEAILIDEIAEANSDYKDVDSLVQFLPEEILQEYSAAQNLDKTTIDLGLELLRSAQ